MRTSKGFKRKAFLIGGSSFCVVALFRYYFLFVLTIGESMQPTLAKGDLLLVFKKAYAHADPRRGEIIIADTGRELIVKRIVAVAGETAEVKDGALFIDGNLIPEHYTMSDHVPFEIAKGTLFGGRFATLGDNRAIPAKEAFHPIVSKEQIVGRACLCISFSRFQVKRLTNPFETH